MTPEIAELVEAGLAAIAQIVATIEAAKAGTVSPATATAAIASFQQSLAANNAAADAALAAKFPGTQSAP
jgi:hypothetical protein